MYVCVHLPGVCVVVGRGRPVVDALESVQFVARVERRLLLNLLPLLLGHPPELHRYKTSAADKHEARERQRRARSTWQTHEELCPVSGDVLCTAPNFNQTFFFV